jgi:V8-like Glu-specific endopeptidase
LILSISYAASNVLAQSVEYNQGSIFDIDPPSAQSTGNSILESIQGSDDMELVGDLGESDLLRLLSSPVGRLAIAVPNGTAYCTASLIDDDKILTNYHCLPTLGGSAARFQLGYLKGGSDVGVESFDVNVEPLEANQDLDYSILSLGAQPGKKWGKIALSIDDPPSNNALFIIHHPGGFAKQITRGRCKAANPAIVGDDLRHVCDTLPGSSGAPVFDNNTRKVVGLHNRSLGLNSGNSSIRIASIAESSSLVSDILASGQVATLKNALPSDDYGDMRSGTKSYKFEGIDVVYFEKAEDKGGVEAALNNRGIKYRKEHGKMENPTDRVSCSPDVDFDLVKSIALTLYDVGIQLYNVTELEIDLPHRIVIDSDGNTFDRRPMTRKEIVQLDKCAVRKAARDNVFGQKIWIEGKNFCESLIKTVNLHSGEIPIRQNSGIVYLDASNLNEFEVEITTFEILRDTSELSSCYAKAHDGGVFVNCSVGRDRDDVQSFISIYDQIRKDVRGCLVSEGWSELPQSSNTVSEEIRSRRRDYGFKKGDRELWVYGREVGRGDRTNLEAGIEWPLLLTHPRRRN